MPINIRSATEKQNNNIRNSVLQYPHNHMAIRKPTSTTPNGPSVEWLFFCRTAIKENISNGCYGFSFLKT